MDWIRRVIERVSGHEGGYASLNRNTDNAGLSFGILQWSQATGQLGVLLQRMRAADPPRFEAIFGPHWEALLQATKAGSLGPVAGAVLWTSPWAERFARAGSDPVFQAVQRRLAREGEHMRGAIAASEALGIATERALALLYDTAVQQGPGAALTIARQALEVAREQGPLSDGETLAWYAQRAADRHRRRTEPSRKVTAGGRLEWRRVGDHWHQFAGSIDLYENIRKRRGSILADRNLGDARVALS